MANRKSVGFFGLITVVEVYSRLVRGQLRHLAYIYNHDTVRIVPVEKLNSGAGLSLLRLFLNSFLIPYWLALSELFV